MAKTEKQRLVQKTVNNRIIDGSIGKKVVEERFTTKGNGKYVDEGMIARLFNYYVITPDKIKDPASLQSFYTGYRDNANFQLTIMISTKKIPEKIIQTIEEKKFPIEIPKVEEILYNVGAKDAQEGYEITNETIKNNIYYQAGYYGPLEIKARRGRK